MKRTIFTLAVAMLCNLCFGQEDSTNSSRPDTIRIGNMIIVKKAGNNDGKTITMSRRSLEKNSNISTSWFIVDLGFANYDDNTNYASATSGNYILNRPGKPDLGENDFKLKTGKSSNVNIWIVMQRLNLVKNYVNLKYGFGIEMNNYRFKSSISFKEGGPNPANPAMNIAHPFVFRDSVDFTKNKLAADYATVPFMINFITNPGKPQRGLTFSAGMSAGYLFSSRNKQVSGARGKWKNRGDYGLEKWKISYIGELGLGPIRLYGSYSPNSIFENGFNMKPYAVGIRLSNW